MLVWVVVGFGLWVGVFVGNVGWSWVVTLFTRMG